MQASGSYRGTFARPQIHPVDPTQRQMAMSCFKTIIDAQLHYLLVTKPSPSCIRAPSLVRRCRYSITPWVRHHTIAKICSGAACCSLSQRCQTALFLRCVQLFLRSIVKGRFTCALVTYPSLTAQPRNRQPIALQLDAVGSRYLMYCA